MGKRTRRSPGAREALLALLLLVSPGVGAADPAPEEAAPSAVASPEAQPELRADPRPEPEAEAPPEAEAEGEAGAEALAEPAPPRPRYEAVDPGERRGRTLDPGELRTDTREPSFGSHTEDLGEHRGDSRPLRELSRPPGPRPPEEEEEVPAPLRLRRAPGEELPSSAPLAARLCDAEQDLRYARAEQLDAVAAYKRARRAEYPRGDAKALVVQRRELAGRRLARAEAALDALLAEAGEQGVDFDAAECRSGG
jgi:hypothetical protein